MDPIPRSVLMLAIVAAAAPAHAAETAVPRATGNDSDRIICRKTAETGSLVKKTKQCFTRAEWDRLAEAHQRGIKRLQDELSARSGGN